MSKTRRLTLLSVLTAASLCVFVLEAQIPPLIPAVPGVKLGLANIFTLFVMDVLGAGAALAVMLVRVVLGAFVTGQVSAMAYSLAGGILSYLLLVLLHRWFPAKQLWALSALCAMAHNFGQILLAVFVLGSRAVFGYLPVLLLSAIVTGCFTGVACQFVLSRLRAGKFIEEKNENRR